jgi:hypothetical protein
MDRTFRRIIPLLLVALAGAASAQSQVLPQPTNSDPSAPLSPTVQRTTSEVPSPTSAAHTASEVLAYLVAYDNVAIALARQGRDRRVDPQIRALASSMLTNHIEDLARVRELLRARRSRSKPATSRRAPTWAAARSTDVARHRRRLPGRFLDAVTELNRDLVDLVDKRLLSDADDPRMVKHLQATRDRVQRRRLALVRQVAVPVSFAPRCLFSIVASIVLTVGLNLLLRLQRLRACLVS